MFAKDFLPVTAKKSGLNKMQILPARSTTYLQLILSIENMIDLKTKFGIGDIPVENCRLRNMNWMLMTYKNPNKARFIIASPKSPTSFFSRQM